MKKWTKERTEPVERKWEEFYRNRNQCDKVVRSTHGVNCTGSCSWEIYVKNGVVWREEQKSPYAASNASLPDFNPRGCQKGACASTLMYSPSRVRYPLRRVGPRGSGQWERVTWDDALRDIAVARSLPLGIFGASTGGMFLIGYALDLGGSNTLLGG